jgi:hypothetical protein
MGWDTPGCSPVQSAAEPAYRRLGLRHRNQEAAFARARFLLTSHSLISPTGRSGAACL